MLGFAKGSLCPEETRPLGGRADIQATKVSIMETDTTTERLPGALITAQAEKDRLQAERESITHLLRDLREDLEQMAAKMRGGEGVKTPEVKALLTDMRYWLKALRETEAELETIRRKEAGITGGYGLDMERARVEIGCRLDRLRRCCSADPVSG